METSKAFNILQKANHELETAKSNYYKPKDDVVTIPICNHLKKSIFDYLSFFLTLNGVPHEKELSLDDMKKICETLDPAFNTLDFSEQPCFCHDSESCNQEYCLEVNRVNQCLEQVEVARDLIFKLSGVKKHVL
jgi:hypothetical protein